VAKSPELVVKSTGMRRVFFAFSTFVMTALGIIEPARGISAMQAINITVINPWFMTPFMGMAFLSVIWLIAGLLRWHEPWAAYVVAGSLLHFVGTFLVTMLFNVLRNNALARVVATTPQGAALWADYLVTWTWWNHVRTIAALAAAAAFVLALTR
jgi:uncharacterized membrane protein